MDDIRRPQPQLPRRDYTLGGPQQPQMPPAQKPQAHPLSPQPQPLSSLPPAQTPPQPAQTEPLLFNQPAPEPMAASQDRQSYDYRHQANSPTPASQPTQRRGLLKLASPKMLAAIGASAVLLIAAGFYLAKPAKKAGATAAQLAKKSSFSFYYPQPLPAGYSYVNDINAFNNGQAYFMLANGKKHIVLHEQAAGSSSSGAEAPANIEDVSSSVGKVAIGTTAGEPSAQINAGGTYILINTTGSVSKTDLINVINNLKIIK